MPSRNTLKDLAAESVYHVYNRGVEKRNIFLEPSDYAAFINRFEQTLIQPDELTTKQVRGRKAGERLRSYYGDIELLAFCLMPNHFHLLVYQKDADALPKFMSTLLTSYSMYFNRKYRRVGSLFQGRYKAALIDNDSYYSHISRYIHLNPLDIHKLYKTYEYSSFQYYGLSAQPWITPDKVLADFEDIKAYREFVADYEDNFHVLEQEYSLN